MHVVCNISGCWGEYVGQIWFGSLRYTQFRQARGRNLYASLNATELTPTPAADGLAEIARCVDVLPVWNADDPNKYAEILETDCETDDFS